MAQAGQTLEGPTGHRLHLLELTDEALVMEAGYAGDGSMPPMHLHPSQVETFTVLTGAIRTVIDGAERTYEAGETFDVAAGTPHQMGADVPSTMRWEVRPALRTAEFFEQLYGGKVDDFAAFLDEFSAEIRFV